MHSSIAARLNFGCDRVLPLARIGFTLIELLVVIVVIMVLIGLLLPALAAAKDKTNKAAARQAISQLTSSMELYAAEDDRKRYPYPGPFPANTNPYGLTATTYFRAPEATDPERAFAVAFTDNNGGTTITGVLTLLDTKKMPLPVLVLDNSDGDRRLLDPWGRPYRYRLSLPLAVRSTFVSSIDPSKDPMLKDWNWNTAKNQESLRSGADPTKARPYPYIYSWGKNGTATDSSGWLYQVDRR